MAVAAAAPTPEEGHDVVNIRYASGARRGALSANGRARGVPHIYRGRARHTLKDLYDADHAEARQGWRFRWLVSTCLAGAVGAIAILVVIYGSTDLKETGDGLLPAMRRIRDNSRPLALRPQPRRPDGLLWATPKGDRLQMAAGASSTRYVIHETVKQRRLGREYIQAKPYVRVVARLSAATADYADVIPPFNPYKLYGSSQPIKPGEQENAEGNAGSDVSIRVVELLGGILPGEDGQELDGQEVAEIVERSQLQPDAEPLEGRDGPSADTSGRAGPAHAQAATPPNTTDLVKSGADDADASDDAEGREVRVVKVGAGDNLLKLLIKAGAESWQARAMVEAARGIFPDAALAPGQELQLTLVPSLTQQDRMEPIRFTILAEGREHRVTVSRNAAGEFSASALPTEANGVGRLSLADSDKPQSASLYASVYQSGLVQNVPPETITQILRIHAYDTDFRRQVYAGDTVELFFDMKDDSPVDGAPGELLYSSITSGGETSRFYRFRTPDGAVDYYDEQGNNSKKFLMRKPVRGADVRLTSGFGLRFHPLLNERKMHTGVDWAAPPGTPVLASGNGTIEEAGRKGHYGNYIRIRHANGYQTAYGHMLRLAAGVDNGIKVRQGQVIGFVGTTGLSSGPHLHFEVLVNKQFVDPLSIQVPRERQLTGRLLAEFHKERAHIDDLMRRAPVMTASK